MTRCLTIGSATYDTILRSTQNSSADSTPNSFLGWHDGAKIELDTIIKTSGGGGTNTAACFNKLGFETTACFKIGNDPEGSFILNDLSKRNIQTHHTIDPKNPTSSSYIIPSPQKDRIIFSLHGANKTLAAPDIPLEIIANHDLIYIASLHGKAADLLPHLTSFAQKNIERKGIKVAVNPGTSQLEENSAPLKASLSSIDVLVLNSDEMKLLMASLKPRFFHSSGDGLMADGPSLMRTIITHQKISFTLVEYCKEILSYGVKRVVVTDGKNGVYVAIKGLLYYHPAIPVPVINTLGAGDAFSSTFVAALLSNKKIEDAITYGLLNASSVIQHDGAKIGLLTFHEMDHQRSNYKSNLLETFTI